MKKRLLFLLFSFSSLFADLAVTYAQSDGTGLGDHLLGYLHAKWVSYRYGYRLLYKPFLYSNAFALHDKEEVWAEEKELPFKKIYDCSAAQLSVLSSSDQVLCEIPFFSDLPEDWSIAPIWGLQSIVMNVDWSDQGFRAALRDSFWPRKGSVIRKIVRDEITVALHTRRGAPDDLSSIECLLKWPLRFAPDNYYIKCLKELISMFPGKALYVHVFTDASNPKTIIERWKGELEGLPIYFSYREENDRSDEHVVEDFFAMLGYDCLIRSLSNYTLVPSLIGDYRIVMTPKSGYWEENKGWLRYQVDEINIESRFITPSSFFQFH